MSNQDLIRALNRIHLEVALLENLLNQYRIGACQENLKVLETAMSTLNDNPVVVNEEWCLTRLYALAGDFDKQCEAVIDDPKLIGNFPSVFNCLFQVIQRCEYNYMSEEDYKDTLDVVMDMLIAADDYIPEMEFHHFLYWFEANPEYISRVAEIPRIIEMSNRIIDEQQRLRQKEQDKELIKRLSKTKLADA